MENKKDEIINVENKCNIWNKRMSNLLSVKSLVTLVNTAVFAYLAVRGQIAQDFMTIYAVIIAFYFGTQSSKEGSSQ